MVPQIEGLRVDDFMEYANSHPALLRYLPNERDWLHVDKEWVCNILNSVDFEGIQKMLLEARKKRK